MKRTDLGLSPIAKRCFTCKEEKLLQDFNKDRRNRDGMTCVCKYCRNLRRKQKYQKNKEGIREAWVRSYYKKTYGDDWREMRELVKLDKEIRNEKAKL